MNKTTIDIQYIITYKGKKYGRGYIDVIENPTDISFSTIENNARTMFTNLIKDDPNSKR